MANIVEQKAIKFVMDCERKKGRNPKIVMKAGCDIISSGRYIEVEGQSSNGTGNLKQDWFNFDHRCFEKMQKEKNYYVYVVYNIPVKDEKIEPKLIKIPREDIISGLRGRWTWEIFLGRKKLKELEKEGN